jgi:hypothetical protein
MVLHFDMQATGIVAGASEACVKGNWIDTNGSARKFFGCDAVRTTGK